MFLTLTKRSLHAIAFLALTFCVMLFAVWIWLAAEERSLMPLMPWLQKWTAESGYEWDVKDARLRLAGLKRTLDITLDQLDVKDPVTGMTVHLPEVTGGVNMLPLLAGRLSIEHIILKKPALSLSRSESGDWSFSTENAEDGQMLTMFSAWMGVDKDHIAPRFKRLYLREASVTLRDYAGHKLAQAPSADIELEQQRDGTVQLALQSEVQLLPEVEKPTLPVLMQGKLHILPKEKQLDALLTMKGIDVKQLAAVDARLAPASIVNGMGDVQLEWQMKLPSELVLATVTLSMPKATLTEPTYFPQPLQVENLEARFQIAENGKTVLLDTFSLKSGEASLQGHAVMETSEQGRTIDTQVTATQFPVDELENYWPLTLYPDSRAWVTTNIKGGVVPKATATVRLLLPVEGEAAVDQLQAVVEVAGTRVSYYENLPTVLDVDGVLTFAPTQMDIAIQKGRIGEMQVTQGTLQLADMMAEKNTLVIDLTLDGAAKEVASYLAHPMFAFMKPVKLDPAGVKGEIKGQLHMDVPLSDDGVEDTRRFAMKAETTLVNVSTSPLFDMLPVEGANGVLNVSNQQLYIKGTANIQGGPAEIELTDRYHTEGVQDTDYKLKMKTTPEQLARMGFTLPGFLKGTLGVEGTLSMKGKEEKGSYTLDLTQGVIDFSDFGYTKPVGQAGTLELTTHTKDGKELEVSRFNLTAPGMKAEGSTRLLKATGEVLALDMKRAVFGKNDLGVLMTRTAKANGPAVLKIDIKGTAVDIGQYYREESLFGSDTDIPQMELNASVDRVIFGEGLELRQVKAKASCSKDMCLSASGGAQYGQNHRVTYQLGFENGVRAVRINADNAGQLFEILDITENIKGGTLDVTGAYADDAPEKPLKGVAIIRDFSSVKAPGLAKLLNVASLTGIGELLKGGGVGFDMFTAPFTIAKGVIHVKEGKSIGNSLGITFSGAVDMNSKTIGMDGSLIPSYTLNSFVGNIPLIGQLLVGKEGEGVFGFTYSVKGPTSDPEVSVNPLSVLAPGFLRQLFEGSSYDPDAKEKPPKKEEEYPSAK